MMPLLVLVLYALFGTIYTNPLDLQSRVLGSVVIVFLDISITFPWVCEPNIWCVYCREVFDASV